MSINHKNQSMFELKNKQMNPSNKQLNYLINQTISPSTHPQMK